jgi:hypothetical protein
VATIEDDARRRDTPRRLGRKKANEVHDRMEYDTALYGDFRWHDEQADAVRGLYERMDC